jgi:3-phenylpropionate/trans-cinnamate dioxygenase ferredoxin reductase subunit
MMTELPGVERLVVIGGVTSAWKRRRRCASSTRRSPCWRCSTVLARLASEPLSRFYAHGVDVRLGTTVDCILETDGRASGVRLADTGVTLNALAAEVQAAS